MTEKIKLLSSKACFIYALILLCTIFIIQMNKWGSDKFIVFRWHKGKGLRAKIENGLKETNTICCFGKKEMLVVVTSHVDNFHRRTAIRQTWGNISFFTPRPIHVYFLLKNQHKEKIEIEKYKDVFLDYENISKKLEDVDYVLHTTDDVYINLPKLYEFFPCCYSELMMGYLMRFKHPVEKHICHTCLETVNTTERFLGSTYVLSQDIAKQIYNILKKYSISKEGYNEYITTVIPSILNVTLWNHQMFTYINNVTDPCILQSIVVSNNLTSEEIYDAHNKLTELNEKNHLCEGIVYISRKGARYLHDKFLGPDNPYGPYIVIQNTL